MSATAAQVSHYAGMAAEAQCSRRAVDAANARRALMRKAIQRLRLADAAGRWASDPGELFAAELAIEWLIEEVVR